MAIITENLGFWRPTWRQVGTKIEAEIDVIFEWRLFEKTLFFRRKNILFGDPVGRSWEKNQLKIDVKIDAETERLENSILIDL